MQGAIPFARRDRFRRHGQWRRGNAIAAEVGFQPIVNSASVTEYVGDDSRNHFTAMPAPKIKTSASDAIIGLWKVALTAFVVATLYVARELLIPFALSALLTFLLAPLVTRIERWIGRIAAVLVVVALIFSAMGLAGWLLTRQLVDLANKLPEYKGNIVAKMHAFDVPQGGKFTQLSETLDELKKELPGGDEPAVPVSRGYGYPTRVSPPSRPEAPAQAIENSKTDPIALVQLIVAPLVGPLGMAALVVLLVIFMLLQREDLRNRVIRLIGQGRISATTRAMDDAGCRVSRFLLMQLIINVTYGVVVAAGLYFIGVPNAALWGAFGTVLRFIPYVGPWIAAIFPTLLALAVSPHWTMPLLTIALFAVLELIVNNVLEPWLYGAHTGVSSIALIMAAVFWTWMWGPLGLVLATPLTVCLVVMGRHVPRLAFLGVLLSDEEALTPAEDCYHRLLTPGERDELELVEAYLKANSLVALYDTVFIPVLSAAEIDVRAGLLDPEQLQHLEQGMRDIIEDLGTRPVPVKRVADGTAAVVCEVPGRVPDCRIYCLPVRADRDEMAGAMLVQVARQQGFAAQNAPALLTTGEMLGVAEKAEVDVICLSVVAPSTVIHARYLCLKLRAAMPNQKIVIGLWGVTEELAEATKRLRDSGADEVVTTLGEALVQMAKLAPPLPDEPTPAPIPADEEERLAALAELNLLDTAAEPVFDRITATLARVFEVPIALITLVDRDRQFFKSQIGLPEALAQARQTPRNVSACGHVIAKNEILVIEDLARDRRFTNNPLFKEYGIRFYAGVPLLAPNGQPIGSLCLMDMKPRQLSEREKRLLQQYAIEVMEEIATRVPQSKRQAL
jgi:predicted PurR-regulated permease PerM/methylmalonyl-CoA mutase cobalamin-binding subunit